VITSLGLLIRNIIDEPFANWTKQMFS